MKNRSDTNLINAKTHKALQSERLLFCVLLYKIQFIQVSQEANINNHQNKSRRNSMDL